MADEQVIFFKDVSQEVRNPRLTRFKFIFQLQLLSVATQFSATFVILALAEVVMGAD